MRTTQFGHHVRPHPWGERPDDLPLSTAVWDKAKAPRGETSSFVTIELYEAVKQLKTGLPALRATD